MYVCMYVCRGGIIDSPPGLKTSLSPSSPFFLSSLTLARPLQSHKHTLSFQQSAPRQSGHRRRRVHPKSCVYCTVQLDRNTSLGPRLRTVYYTNQPYSSCVQQAYSASVSHKSIYSFCRSLFRYLPSWIPALNKHDSDETPRLSRVFHWLAVEGKTPLLEARLP
jgi:hypothetical protein